MLYTDFSASLQLEENLRELDEARAALDPFASLPREYDLELRRHVLAQSVHYSTRIEGNRLTIQQVETVLAGESVAAPPDQIREVQNYKEALEYVEAVAARAAPLSVETILAIHYLVSKGLSGSYAPGRFRADQNFVVDRISDRRVFLPPPPDQAPVLIAELVAWLNAHHDVPAPIRAGLAHLNLVAIHPFADGNGRTARVLGSLLLYAAGYRSQHLVSLEAYFGRDTSGYYAAIAQALGRSFNPPRDVSAWVDYHLRAHITQVRAALAPARRMFAVIDGLQEYLAGLRLSAPQLGVLFVACIAGQVTNRSVRAMGARTPQSTAADLAWLVECDLLERHGNGRSTRYIPTQRLRAAYERIRNEADEGDEGDDA